MQHSKTGQNESPKPATTASKNYDSRRTAANRKNCRRISEPAAIQQQQRYDDESESGQ
jgi:hypothetical protein